jgi:hypothetical protein
MATLANKKAVLKIVGMDHPIHVKLHLLNADGVLVIEKSLALELKKLAKSEGLEGFLGETPLIFFPHCRIEWMMVSAE